jgi:hypothetical protein
MLHSAHTPIPSSKFVTQSIRRFRQRLHRTRARLETECIIAGPAYRQFPKIPRKNEPLATMGHEAFACMKDSGHDSDHPVCCLGEDHGMFCKRPVTSPSEIQAFRSRNASPDPVTAKLYTKFRTNKDWDADSRKVCSADQALL